MLATFFRGEIVIEKLTDAVANNARSKGESVSGLTDFQVAATNLTYFLATLTDGKVRSFSDAF